MTPAGTLRAREELLLACVHCGFCLPACPTYTRLGDEADSPRGRLHLMRAVVEGRLDPGDPAFQVHIDRCLGCRACETACPSGVEYGLLLEGAREAAAEAVQPRFLTQAFLALFRHPRALAFSMVLSRTLRATRVPRLAARWLPERAGLRRLRLGMAMLAASAPRPPERIPVPDRARPGTAPPEEAPAALGASQAVGAATAAGGAHVEAATPDRAADRDEGEVRVGVLRGCVQAGLFGRVGAATRRTLEANGYRVVKVEGQSCCGAIHAHSGDLEAARALARRNVRAFRAAGVDRVVADAAGCGAALREYGHLLEDDPELGEDARRIAAATRDVAEALAERGPRTGAPLPLRVTYDAPCHLLHAQRVADPPLDVLRAVPGLELVPLEGAEECCGGAGIYGITHPELGGRVARDKVRAVEATGARLVATGNPGCMMQIGAGLLLSGSDVAAVHPIEILDESYRRGGIYETRGPSPPVRATRGG